MTIRSLAIALLGLAIAALAADPANASCESNNRIQKANTDCLSGWWSNRWRWTPPSPQTKGGVTNHCNMGTMKVKINIGGASDLNIYENSGGGQTRYDWRLGQTSGQYCCHDYGPCWDNEIGSVEDTIIWRMPGSTDNFGSLTRQGTYNGKEIEKGGCIAADEFCKSGDMDKTWFCKRSFKAAKKLSGECGKYDCDGRYCDWGDCKYQWSLSQADDTCDFRDGGKLKWKAKCEFKVRCIKGVDDDGNLAYRDSKWEGSMWKADNLINCSGRPRREDKTTCDNLGTDQIIGYNCADETEICAVDHCSAGFEDSDADDSCTVTSMSLDASDWSDPKCNVAVTCVDEDESTTSSSLDDVPMAQMADLKDCDGTLTNGDCDDG